MKNVRSIAALAVAATVGLGLTACGNDDDNNKAAGSDDTAAAAASSTVCPSGKLTFGVEPYEDAAKLTPAYQALASALGDKLHCSIEVQIVQSYVGEILAMKNGKLDLGEFGPLGFVFAQRQAGAVPLASFADSSGQLSTYTAAIWVPKGSSISSIADLKGHTLALSETGSTSGDALPRQQLIEAKIDKDVKVQYAGGHPEALLALTHGKVDAAEINSQTLATATKDGTFDESKYTKVWESDPIANDPVTVSPKIDAQAQQTIKDALLSLSPDSVKEIGQYLDFATGSTPMVEVTTDTYKPLFDLADALGLTPKDL